MTIVPSLCRACTRWTGKGCPSFPGGIPDEIALHGADHRETLGGEPPFERAPGKDDEYTAWLAWHEAELASVA